MKGKKIKEVEVEIDEVEELEAEPVEEKPEAPAESKPVSLESHNDYDPA